MLQPSTKRFVLCLASALIALALSPAHAQTSSTVSVNASSSLAAIPAAAYGVNTAVWDGLLLDSPVSSLLQSEGITAMRFPGGSTADVYHWQTNSITSGQSGYANPNNTFAAFIGAAKSVGAVPIITVNYGSNAAGNGGGSTSEAAAWVQNADVTNNYGVTYWEIGNEVYGNGEYGSSWECDLHSSHTPTTYGQNVVQFASAMKAVDSNIKIGAVLCAPGQWPDGQSPNWNTNVLSACGTSIDFVVVHWYPENPGSESDSTLLGDTSQIASMVSTLRSLINEYCGSNAPNVQIFVTETNSVSSNPGKQTLSTVNALFLADDYMDWLENGVSNVDIWDLHNGANTGGNNSSSLYGSATYGDYGILASGGSPEPAAETPFASYYGIQMLSDLGRPGDTDVSSSSSNSLLAVHAVKQASGKLAVLLINKDPNNTCTANVSISGFTPSSSATTYFYGKSSSAITSSSATVGSSFSVSCPPYSMTTVVMSPGSSQAPTFTATATASPSTVSPGSVSTISASFKDTGAALSNGIADIEVYNSSGTQVAQQYFTGQNWSAGGTNNYTYNWTSSSTTGTYTVELGVFNSTWGTQYYWNSNAAKITDASGDSAEYNFESGTQSWTDSGGIISGVSSSTTQAYAGSHSLAVSFSGTTSGSAQAYVSSPSTPAGKVVTFHVWIPSGSQISAIQPYVQQGSSGGWTWTGNYQTIGSLKTNAWNTLTVTVPSNAVTPLYQMGVQFFTGAAWTGTCYVDSVSW